MIFANAQMLYALWLAALAAVLLRLARRRRQRKLEQVAAASLLPDLTATLIPGRRAWKDMIMVGVLALSILALARPQWGFEWQEVKRQGLDILVVIDTSKSMLTRDVKPDRLQRTKLAVKDLIRKLNGDRIGLIAFAGDAFLVCPLTLDYNGFLLSLKDIDVGVIPQGGTNLAAAIHEAIKEYDTTASKYKAVIIVTDGESLAGDPLAAAREAKKKGIRVYCVGIGTKEGELIQVPDAVGQLQFLKDAQGNFVKSRLNENLLQRIALLTDGIYVRASGAQFGLELIYDKELSKFEKREIASKMQKRYFERFQFPLALALALLILEALLPLRREDPE